MNLVRAELERLGSRRFVQLMLVLLLLALGITTATTLAGSHRPSVTEVQNARAAAAQEIRGMELEYERCVAQLQGQRPADDFGTDKYPTTCSPYDPGQFDRLPIATDYLDGVFVFAHEAEPLLYFLIAYLVLFGFLVGASFIGADLNSGGVVNLLLWRPRRLTVLATKLGTLLGALLLLSVVASAVYLGAFWTIGQLAGLPGTVDGEFWRSLGLLYGRGVVLALIAGATGFALATLGRHTSAALGTVAAYAVVWELGARLVMEIVGVERVDQLMLTSHVGAWLNGRVEFWDGADCGPHGCVGSYEITSGPALVVLLGVAGVLCAAAFALFRRRDLI
ncbi:ABC transporter permease subunit [Micromonospora sp. SH-82]|uniref:ABC transporter permease subunit n=1 Tax=Micromonospora sp. SH-82 TaxID=3132938 RepID=UPI003EBB69D6